jgi:hypothetical protein
MIGGEACIQNVLGNTSMAARDMLTAAMEDEFLESCTVKIMILGDNALF